MNVRTTLFRPIRLVAIILLAIVLVPYGFSRVASSCRRLSVHVDMDLPAGKSNWRGGTAEKRKTRLHQIAELLGDIDADIVVLNEVDFDSSWSSSTNQARYLAKQAGYPYWAEQRNLDFRVLTWKWRFGNAVLSRYPIVQASVIDLPGFSTVETFFAGKKRALNCTVELNGDKVRILAVHLCHRSEAIRARSAEVITEIASSDSVAAIIAGDFNSSPVGFPNSESDTAVGNAMGILDASALFQRQPEQPSGSPAELTYHSTQPASTIDWILVPKNWQIVEYRVESSALSDHRPVVAELSLELMNEAPSPK